MKFAGRTSCRASVCVEPRLRWKHRDRPREEQHRGLTAGVVPTLVVHLL